VKSQVAASHFESFNFSGIVIFEVLDGSTVQVVKREKWASSEQTVTKPHGKATTGYGKSIPEAIQLFS